MTEPITHNVVIENISAVDAIAIKQELVQQYNLIDGKDFTWAWYPEVLDSYSYFVTRPKHLEVRFCNQSTATFFQLRYSQ